MGRNTFFLLRKFRSLFKKLSQPNSLRGIGRNRSKRTEREFLIACLSIPCVGKKKNGRVIDWLKNCRQWRADILAADCKIYILEGLRVDGCRDSPVPSSPLISRQPRSKSRSPLSLLFYLGRRNFCGKKRRFFFLLLAHFSICLFFFFFPLKFLRKGVNEGKSRRLNRNLSHGKINLPFSLPVSKILAVSLSF